MNRDYLLNTWSKMKEPITTNRMESLKACHVTGSAPAPPVPDVTDLSGTSRGALPPPPRGTAFELLLAVMFVCNLSGHLSDKHKDVGQSKSFITRVSEHKNTDLYCRLNFVMVDPVC